MSVVIGCRLMFVNIRYCLLLDVCSCLVVVCRLSFVVCRSLYCDCCLLFVVMFVCPRFFSFGVCVVVCLVCVG